MAEPITNVLGTVAIKHCGAYDATVHYEKLNVVTYNGSSYCAKDNTIGNLPTDTTYWDLMAEKGDKGETGEEGYTPVKGTDYYTDADKAELETTLSSDVTTEVTSQLGSLTSATPLVASSVSNMTDTTRIYVNTTDGHWYWYDGVTWQDGGVYQATEIDTELQNRIYSLESEIKTELYEPTEIGYIRVDGGLENNNNAKHTNYIDLRKYEKIEYRSGLNSAGYALAFYDENKSILHAISIPGNGSSIKTEDVPATARYVILSTYGIYVESYIKLYCENSLAEVVPKLQEDVEELQEKVNEIETNLIVKTFEPTINGYIYADGGVDTSSNAKRTDYIKLGEYNKIEYQTYLTTAGCELAFYNESKTFIAADKVLGDQSKAVKTVDVPSDATYVILSMYGTSVEPYIKLYCDNSISKDISDIKEKINFDKTYKVLILGDSITQLGVTHPERGWTTYFNKIVKINVIANTAVDGSIIADYSDTPAYDGNPQIGSHNNVLGNQVQKIINNGYETPDFIIISMGTNGGINATEEEAFDSYYNQWGDLKDLSTISRQTTAGAFRYAIETLRTLYPNVPIFWCSPIQAYNKIRSSRYILQWNQNLHILSHYASIIPVDSQLCGICSTFEENGTEGRNLIDGLHTNVNGAKLLGYYNANIIKQYLN